MLFGVNLGMFVNEFFTPNCMDLCVVPLHKHPEYMLECCELINDEWKRSTTARMRSLECSCDYLPTCLILLKDNKVIGHCKLSIIPSIKEACFVESVVISRTLRGQGHGTYLMNKAEDYCRNNLHLKAIYLSTKGQEQFYSKLGYEKCQPISIYGGCHVFKSPIILTSKEVCKNKPSNGPPPPPMPQNFNNIIQSTKVFMNKFL